MESVTVYCPACRKDVHVTRTAAPLHTGEANLVDDEVVCLTFGPRCPPGTCPLANLPSVVMGVRLARSGIEPEEPWRTVRMRCDGCESVQELEVIDNVHAFCPACGTTNRWFKLEMGEDALAVTLPPVG